MTFKNSDEDFIEAVKSSTSIHEALKKLGLVARGGAYSTFKNRCKALNLSLDHFSIDKHLRKQISNEKIIELCTTLKSRRAILIQLELRPDTSANVSWIDKKIQELNIDTSHWTGQLWSKGKTLPHLHTPANDYLGTSKTITSYSLKLKLISQNILENKCAVCGILEWQGKPLSLHLDHINGDHSNNSLENLRLLCPNCHSQTHTYCRRKTSLE